MNIKKHDCPFFGDIAHLIVEYEYARFGCAANTRGSHIQLAMGEIWHREVHGEA